MYWHSIKKEKPTEPGIYAVAVFDGGELVEFSPAWACLGGYFGPNIKPYFGSLDITHWMPQKDYYKALEQLPRED